MVKHVLVVASTFPASDMDPVPRFVKDQILALRREYPGTAFSVLAPHAAYGGPTPNMPSMSVDDCYAEYRFRYFWPSRFEKLAGRGILPTLQENPAYYLLIPFFILGEFFALWRLARKLKPDVIYAHWFTPQGIVAGWVSKITGIPFVYTSHSSDVSVLRKLVLVGPWLVRHFSGQAQAISVVSTRSLERLRGFFTEAQWDEIRPKVAVIPMGVDLQVAPPQRIASQRNGQNILYLGRLVEKKGIQYLLPAFASILEDYPRATLTVAGSGPWLKRLQDQARALKIPDERIHFPGYVSGLAKGRLVSGAQLFVVPSIVAGDGDTEGLPVALLEGLATGKICIATKESGADDILRHGINGFLVPQKAPADLEVVLRTVFELNSQQRSEIVHAAVRTARPFSWVDVAREHGRFLFRMTDAHKA